MKEPLPFDLARLAALRRSAGLTVHTEGHLLHEGDRFAHERLEALLLSGLDLHPDSGEAILRVGAQWCYVGCDATPFVVQAASVGPDGLQLRLNTGLEASLAPDQLQLWLEGDSRLWVEVPMTSGRRWARCNRAVWQRLSERLALDDADALWLQTASWSCRVQSATHAPIAAVQA